MFLLDLLAKLGSVVLKIFKGRTGKIVSALEPLATAAIDLLFLTGMSGTEKWDKAVGLLTNFGLLVGLDRADHAINLLIEWKIAEKRGKNIEKIFDQGLQRAREVVAEVGKLTIAADLDKKLEAAEQLRMKLTHDMKAWLTDKNTLYLLIEAAVAETKE